MNYIILFVLFLIFNCKQEKDNAELSILGLSVNENYYYFEGRINKDITPYCGEIVQNSSGSTSSGSSGSQTSQTQTQTQFDVNSYYVFQYGDYMQLRYTYDKNRQKFTLVPSTTTITTCNTSDFINCSSSGTATCETADSIKCGGTKAFIFVGVIRPLQFQAVSGTLEWSKGFSLTSDSKYVQRANLEFSMVDRLGNILKGKILCNSSF
ncbi:MAG: hypothetical protein ACK4UJ_10075 [Leptonema sp. (in: bacteria)]